MTIPRLHRSRERKKELNQKIDEPHGRQLIRGVYRSIKYFRVGPVDLLDQAPHLQMSKACLECPTSLSRDELQLESATYPFRLWTASRSSNWIVYPSLVCDLGLLLNILPTVVINTLVCAHQLFPEFPD